MARGDDMEWQIIERMFNRLKQFRRVATRYDKTARSFMAFLALAAVRVWLPSFVGTVQAP